MKQRSNEVRIAGIPVVAVVNGHPSLARDANEDAGIVIVMEHLIDSADAAIAKFPGRPIQEAHAAVRLDEAIGDGQFAGANMLPAVEILAVE